MFDVGWTELMLIGIVALIVIGPKDLPEMFRQLGRVTAKLRSMSREFQRAMEQAANESGVKDVAKDLKTMTSAKGMGLDAMKDAASKFEKWDPLKNAARPTKPPLAKPPLTPPPMPATPMPAAAAAAAAPSVAVAPTIHGAATQAQIDRQAAKSAILKETAAKLKAVNDAPAPAPAAPKPAPKPRVKAAVAVEAAAPKPRAPRKPLKKADDA